MSTERDEKRQDLVGVIVVLFGFVACLGSSAVAAVFLPDTGNAKSLLPALFYGPVAFASASSVVVLAFRKTYRARIGPPLLWVVAVWAWPLLAIAVFLPGLRF